MAANGSTRPTTSQRTFAIPATCLRQKNKTVAGLPGGGFISQIVEVQVGTGMGLGNRRTVYLVEQIAFSRALVRY